jgi:hypothetical protein
MNTKELDVFRAKITIEDWLIDECINTAEIPADYTGDIVVPFFITPRVYKRVKERYAKAKIYYVETVSYKGFFGKAIPEEDAIYINTEKEINTIMYKFKNPVFIENPPYGSVGGPVVATIKAALPKAKQSILMPISCYKTKVTWSDGREYPLYQFIDTVKVVGSAGFGAVISENNCIATLLDAPDTTKTYEALMMLTVDQRFLEYYKWNIAQAGKLGITPASYTKPEDLNIDTDFIETNRCGSIKSGAGFGKGGCGYKYNVLKAGYEEKWPSGLILITCPDKETKDILSTLWYSGQRKNECLLSKAIIGVNVTTTSGSCNMALPQFDLTRLPISQKALWDAGRYDEAVLAEMGLKWDGDIIVKAD